MKFELFNKEVNKQDFYKFIAIIAMVIDHYGLFFDPNPWFRLVGRMAMPIFCFFAGYNYFSVIENSNKKICLQYRRYKNLLVIGVILQLIIYLYTPAFGSYNILLSILFNICLIDLMRASKISIWIFQLILIALIYPTYDIFDYGTLGSGFVLVGYLARDIKKLGQEYNVYLGLWLFAHYIMATTTMKFGNFQSLLLFIMCLWLYKVLSKNDFTLQVNNKIYLLSRYIMPIYFSHFSLFVIIVAS